MSTDHSQHHDLHGVYDGAPDSPTPDSWRRDSRTLTDSRTLLDSETLIQPPCPRRSREQRGRCQPHDVKRPDAALISNVMVMLDRFPQHAAIDDQQAQGKQDQAETAPERAVTPNSPTIVATNVKAEKFR